MIQKVTKTAAVVGPLILAHDCKHEDQDKFYGKGMRMFIRPPEDAKGMRRPPRCTVCGRDKAI